jgi:hypothetical protein
VDLPFTVIGEGVISDAEDGDFPDPAPTLSVPESVPKAAAIKVLFLAGITEAMIDSGIDEIENETQRNLARIDWRHSTVVRRYSALVLLMADKFWLTSGQVDQMFIQADQIV